MSFTSRDAYNGCTGFRPCDDPKMIKAQNSATIVLSASPTTKRRRNKYLQLVAGQTERTQGNKSGPKPQLNTNDLLLCNLYGVTAMSTTRSAQESYDEEAEDLVSYDGDHVEKVVFRCKKCTFDNIIRLHDVSKSCSVCHSSLYCDEKNSNPSIELKIDADISLAGDELDSTDDEWDILEEGDNKSEDSDAGSGKWELIPSATSWAFVAGTTSFGEKRYSPKYVGLAGRGGDREVRSAEEVDSDEDDECGVDANRVYSLFPGDTPVHHEEQEVKAECGL
eukprot:CAMPEP_0171611260 /NCGR_PEP_ID=MMETSP0990-20121206/10524_1 /TAXON_ID=483369 /ORGANISM="non described non described, Strain CCMP2098" /LENGTH=278 /DNA_ID=CAMNT_0012174797 /DNA_START=137 /DNA_END=972 /DNA_ORIENTATION=+